MNPRKIILFVVWETKKICVGRSLSNIRSKIIIINNEKKSTSSIYLSIYFLTFSHKTISSKQNKVPPFPPHSPLLFVCIILVFFRVNRVKIVSKSFVRGYYKIVFVKLRILVLLLFLYLRPSHEEGFSLILPSLLYNTRLQGKQFRLSLSRQDPWKHKHHFSLWIRH